MTKTQTQVLTASCGCEFSGTNFRFVSSEHCTAGFGEADRATWMLLPGTALGRHTQAAKKKAIRAAHAAA